MTVDFGDLQAGLAALRESLAAIRDEEDRAVARDALRDALDRDAARLRSCALVAGSYAVDGVLHRGPAFEVLRLRQRDLGTVHALKAPLAERARDPLLRRLLLDEARHQSRIDHPACLPLRAVLRLDDGRPAILTDLMPASTLSHILRAGPMAEAAVVRLGLRLCEALGAVHAAGFVHGDLSPANLCLPDADPCRAILFDFGLSRPLGAAMPPDLERAGTPGFTLKAPGAKGPAAPADDLRALGILLRAALDGPASRPLGALLAALARSGRHDGPDLAETARTLKLCGTSATEEAESGIGPATVQPRPV